MTTHTAHHLFPLPSSCLSIYLSIYLYHNHTLALQKTTSKNKNHRITFTFATFPPTLLRFSFPGAPSAFLFPLQNCWGGLLRSARRSRFSTGFWLLMTSMPGVFLNEILRYVQWLKRTKALLHKCLVSFYLPSSLPLWATYFLEHQPVRRRCWEGKGLCALPSQNTGHIHRSRWQFCLCFWGQLCLTTHSHFTRRLLKFNRRNFVQFAICRFTSLVVFIILNKP